MKTQYISAHTVRYVVQLISEHIFGDLRAYARSQYCQDGAGTIDYMRMPRK